MKLLFAFSFFLFTIAALPAYAQKDLTKRVETLPSKDATYMIHQEKDATFYAVKKEGVIISYEAYDNKGTSLSIAKEKTAISGNNPKAPTPGTLNPDGPLKDNCYETICTNTGGVSRKNVCLKVPCSRQ